MTETVTVAPATDSPRPQITEPGVYADLPEAEYHAHPALSSSGARKLLTPSCPAKYRYERDHGSPHKPAFDFGRAAHTLALGAGAKLRVIDADSYRTQAAKGERDEAYAEGQTPVLVHEYEQVQEMAAVLRAHPKAGPLFDAGRGQPEQSLFWTDRQTGVACRCRLDWLPVQTGRRLIVPEYKSAYTASLEGFPKAFSDHGYFIQGAWNLAGLKALDLVGDGDEPVFLFIAQEKEAPYLVTLFQQDAESMRAGRQEMRSALRVFAECESTGIWPGYSDDIEFVSLPGYKARQYDNGEF